MEIVVNEIKTNYLLFGEGKPFIILHGWGSNSEKWIKEAEIISQKGFKVIIPDLPGFGQSDKLNQLWTNNDYVKWFEDFTRMLEIKDFYLLGHSFGGALAAKIAVKYPQRVQKLFLVAAAIIREKTAQKTFSEKISKFIKLFYFLPYYSFFRKAVYKFIIRKSDYIYTEGIMKLTYLSVISEDILHHLHFINIPTIIIWGEKDQSTPAKDAKIISEKIRNSKLIIIPEADHLLHKTMPEVLSEEILNNI